MLALRNWTRSLSAAEFLGIRYGGEAEWTFTAGKRLSVHSSHRRGTRHDNRTRTFSAFETGHGRLLCLVLVAVGVRYVCQAIVFG